MFVQNERYQDPIIISAWSVRRRGVKIHVMARPDTLLKKEKADEGVGGLRNHG